MLLVLAGCATVRPSHPGGPVRIPRTPVIAAVGAAEDGSHVLYARSVPGGCDLLDVDPASKSTTALGRLGTCPDRISAIGGSIELETGGVVSLFPESGKAGEPDVVLRGAKSEVVRTEKGELEWREGAHSTTLPGGLTRIRFMPGGASLIAIQQTDSGEWIVTIGAGGKLTPVAGPFLTIDSYDVSPEGTDVVFSASRKDGFDVAIVDAAGGKPRWVYPDPRDERRVIWAPLGHKIAYVIESVDGSILRTVHVPTGAMLEVAFPWTRIDSIAWMPDARRVAVAESSVGVSSRVELVHYDGSGRQTVVSAAENLASAFDILPTGRLRAIVIPPLRPRYGVRDPLVIRIADSGAAGWSDAQAAILGRTGAGMIIVEHGVSSLGEGFWKAVDSLEWVDHDRIYVIENEAGSLGPMPEGVKVVAAKGRRGRGVTLLPAEPGTDLQDAAASWIIRSLEERS